MSQKNQTRKEFELCQNDMIFTKIFKLYQVFLCQNNKIFTKVSELYQVVTCSNTLNLLGCHAVGINYSLNFFSSTLQFSNSICQAKSLTKFCGVKKASKLD